MRAAQHTLDHVDCPACRENYLAVIMGRDFGRLPFAQASAIYLEARRDKLGRGTLQQYEQYLRPLARFFGALPLEQITVGHIVSYQRERQAEIRGSRQHAAAKEKIGGQPQDPSDGSSRINHEVNCVLRQVLRRAGLWTEIEKFYEPLPAPKHGPGIALTQEEEVHLFKVARSRQRWLVACCCSLLTRNTTAGPGEVRHLRIRAVNADARLIHIQECLKVEERERPLPLNDDALFAVQVLLGRYRRLMQDAGIPEAPDHYLLPLRAKSRGGPVDPTRPMGSWKKAWYALCEEAGKSFPRLAKLRRYDLRHTACTLMLEDASVSYSTIEKMMGHHIGSKVKRKYDHVRDATLRSAAERLNGGHARPQQPDPPALVPTAPGPQLVERRKTPRSASSTFSWWMGTLSS